MFFFFQNLFQIFFLIKFPEQALTVNFFQCDFLLVKRADILLWQVFYSIGFFRHGFTIPPSFKQTFLCPCGIILYPKKQK